MVDKLSSLFGGVVTRIFAMILLSKKERSVCMNIADRIQHLRKTKGISQEELADKIGVSRQSVSKWESEQTTPDIEKIILMSDYFEVSTDYLLKGIEIVADDTGERKEKPDASVFAIAGTAFNFIGLISSIVLWFEMKKAVIIALGLIFIVMGCMIYAIGMTVSDGKKKDSAKKLFWKSNIGIFIIILFWDLFCAVTLLL